MGGVQKPDLPMRLRRIQRIRTIQGSLAIEGNTLSTEQITAILDGKTVIAPPAEIQEVRNALKAYEALSDWQPASEKDLLQAHRLLMAGLLDHPGAWRTGSVGIMKGSEVIHLAPPAANVSFLMRQLLDWLKATDLHPLVASSIFHYEFEFIHPFADGNGRLGRLWQTLILSRWREVFADVPVESLVHAHQAQYYQAINESTAHADSCPFVEFMLTMILAALQESTPEVTPPVTPEVERLLVILTRTMSRQEVQAALGLKDEKNLRQRYLLPALAAGLIERTIPDKPNSRLQKYRRSTDNGANYVKEPS
jgi:Fic family protein